MNLKKPIPRHTRMGNFQFHINTTPIFLWQQLLPSNCNHIEVAVIECSLSSVSSMVFVALKDCVVYVFFSLTCPYTYILFIFFNTAKMMFTGSLQEIKSQHLPSAGIQTQCRVGGRNMGTEEAHHLIFAPGPNSE